MHSGVFSAFIFIKKNYVIFFLLLYSRRPDMTFAVNWALSNNYLSIYYIVILGMSRVVFCDNISQFCNKVLLTWDNAPEALPTTQKHPGVIFAGFTRKIPVFFVCAINTCRIIIPMRKPLRSIFQTWECFLLQGNTIGAETPERRGGAHMGFLERINTILN